MRRRHRAHGVEQAVARAQHNACMCACGHRYHGSINWCKAGATEQWDIMERDVLGIPGVRGAVTYEPEFADIRARLALKAKPVLNIDCTEDTIICTGRTYPLSLFLTEYAFVPIAGGSEGFIWHLGTGNDDPPATLAEKLKDVLKLCVTWGFVGTVTGAPDPAQAAPAPQPE